MKIEDHASRLVERIGVLRHPCDLDLLIASTREGRLAVIWALRRRASGDAGGPHARVESAPSATPARPESGRGAPRPFLVQRTPVTRKRTKTG